MAKWVDVKTFAKMIGTGEHAVYKKIRAGKLDVKKDVNGLTLILVDPEQFNDPSGLTELHDPDSLINFIREAQSQMQAETQKYFKELIDKIETLYESKIEDQKKYHSDVLNLKDNEINTLKERLNEELKTNEKLREELKDKGFFKRLFGG